MFAILVDVKHAFQAIIIWTENARHATHHAQLATVMSVDVITVTMYLTDNAPYAILLVQLAQMEIHVCLAQLQES